MRNTFLALVAAATFCAEARVGTPDRPAYLRKCAPIVADENAAPTVKSSPLWKRRIAFIGDSYVQNHRGKVEDTWHYKLAAKYGMSYFNYGRNGGCIAFARSKFGDPICTRYAEMRDDLDYVVIIAGHNDAGFIQKGGGEHSMSKDRQDEMLATFTEKLDNLCVDLRRKYPKSTIIFISPWKVARAHFDDVIAAERAAAAKHGFEFCDASAQSGVDPNDPAQRAKWFQKATDTAHLNARGHDHFLPAFEKFFLSLPPPAANFVTTADPAEVPVDAPKNMKLILCIGQSNMAGRAKPTDEDRAAVANAYKLNRDNKWVVAKSPYHFDKKVAAVGLVDDFVKLYLKDHPGETVGVVPCAVGGSPLVTWTPAAKGRRGLNLRVALERAKAAKVNGKFIAILWHQGETDASKASAEQLSKYYPRDFKSMVEAVRAEIGDVPVIAGEIGRWMRKDGDHAARINPVIDALPKTVPNCAVASSEGLKNQDAHHFDRTSQRILATRYYEAYKKYVIH